jgi:hypothetical protein
MRALLRHLDWQALFVGFVGGYAVPVLLACFMTGGAWLLWFWIAAPAIAGYLAARVAAKLPLMHGMAVSVVGLLVFGLISSPKPAVAWLVWIAINMACSIFGASIWRKYARRSV